MYLIQCHNRKHAKLSSLHSICFVCRLLVLLPNFMVVIEHHQIFINHSFWPSNITDIDRDGCNITCWWCYDSYIFPRNNTFRWESKTLLAFHRNVIFHDCPNRDANLEKRFAVFLGLKNMHFYPLCNMCSNKFTEKTQYFPKSCCILRHCHKKQYKILTKSNT